MNGELSDDIKKKFMLSLVVELQHFEEKEFHNAQVSPTGIEISFHRLILCFSAWPKSLILPPLSVDGENSKCWRLSGQVLILNMMCYLAFEVYVGHICIVHSLDCQVTHRLTLKE